MLQIRDLHVHYGVIPAIKGISLDVEAGEIVALIGANGAGKTTALHTISGLIGSSSGRILFLDKDITRVQAHEIVRMGISQVPEGRGIFPNLTVLENLFLGAYLRKDKAEMAKDASWAYDLFPRIYERKQQMAGTLSGGELQMLAIARALMVRPKLLLLDEPSMGLAPKLVESIFQTIKRLNGEKGVTILLIEQNALMALEVSHRAYVIETGEIVSSGISSTLMENDDIKRAYLGI